MNVSKLSLEEKIGQKIIIGFRGQSLSNEPIIEQYLKEGLIGGVILYKRDFQTGLPRNLVEARQIKDLIIEIKRVSKVPPFIAIDQEGGKVSRLDSSNGFPEFPSAKEIGNLDNLNYAKEIFDQIANVLYEVGFNMNFAPVLDLCLNPNNEVIAQKGRCFSDKAERVAQFGKVFIESHLEKKILPVAKHFPGHGSSSGDSHKEWVDVSYTWKKIELEPYEILSKMNKLPAVMVGHLFNKHFDPVYPATLSRIWIEEILQKQIGFTGLVISDDMQMKAISDYFSLEETIELSINSGVDILIFSNQLDYEPNLPINFIEIIKKLMVNGKIRESKINQSVEKILGFKSQIMLN